MTPPTSAGVAGDGCHRRATRAVVWLPGLAVATGAAVATAHGLYEVAVAADVPAGIAWLYPLITDGLALVAYAATARLTGGAARYAWAVVVLSAGLSGLAQAAYLAGGSTLDAAPALRFGVGAWPAVAAAVVAHLLHLLAGSSRESVPDPASLPATALPVAAVPAAPVAVVEEIAQPAPADALPPVASGAVPSSVHPDGQRPAYTPEPVHRTVYDAAVADLTVHVQHSEDAPGPYDPDGPDRSTVERPEPTADEHAPRERARAAATRHAAVHGALPTVTELQALAAVSRGTAGAVLKTLRQHPEQRPQPLHLVPDTPEPETQP